jgi:hypothetical protein
MLMNISFLADKGTIDLVAQELKMAVICIDYLNFPPFLETIEENMVKNGDFAFMEYAIVNWVHHLLAGVSGATDHQDLIRHLREFLEVFLEHHWSRPTATFSVPQRTTDRLQFFASSPNYDKLAQAVASAEKQLDFQVKMPKGDIALDLPHVVERARAVIEKVIVDASLTNSALYSNLSSIYGTKVFRCGRRGCPYVSNGFKTASSRDTHVKIHCRPPYDSDDYEVPSATQYIGNAPTDSGYASRRRESPAPTSSSAKERPTMVEADCPHEDSN